MRKKILASLVCGVILGTAAFCQDIKLPEIAIPNGFGFGLSSGERGGDWGISVDVTSPYLRLWGNGELAFRAAGDLLSKEGIPLRGTVDTWNSYYAARLGLVIARVPNDFMRLYGELGGLAIFPTTDVASSTTPSYGMYVNFGGEFFLEKSKHACLFLEIGDEFTFSDIGADKFQGSPTMGTGPSASAGVRYHF